MYIYIYLELRIDSWKFICPASQLHARPQAYNNEHLRNIFKSYNDGVQFLLAPCIKLCTQKSTALRLSLDI